MNKEPKIESGIPIPPKKIGKGIANLLRKMNVGDSVVLIGQRSSISNSAQYALGVGNYTTRVEADGVRVWRTK